LSADEEHHPAIELTQVIARFKATGPHDPEEPEPESDEELSLDFLEPSADPDCLGQLGGYQITEVIGRGGMGIVLKARDPGLDRFVAVKVLSPSLASNSKAHKRFLREARAAAAVSHDHVVAIHAVGESEHLPFLVMEYVCGRSLHDLIESEGPLAVEDILRIGLQVASGLDAAHAQGLVHRDIKPANILLENGVERVKITDFGLAHAVDDIHLTESGVLVGTPPYMSPEQAAGKTVDLRSDLFSLGSTIYAMCTGRPPFAANSVLDAIRRVSEEATPPIEQFNPNIPDWLVEIVEKLLAKDPDQRFQSASEVADLLGQHLAHLQNPEATPPPARLAGAARRKSSPRRKGWGTMAVLLLSLCVTLAWTEAQGLTGISHFVATVLRIKTPHGMLVVKIAEPGVKVTVDAESEAITLTGVGNHVITLHPGRYQWQAFKQGTIADSAWVTIERGGRTTVEVRLQPHEAPANAIDLLKMIELQRDSIGTRWTFDGQALVSPGGFFAHLQIPFVPPEEYDLEVEVERQTGADCLCLGIVVAGQQATLVMDGFLKDGRLTVLQEIDGRWGLKNETSVQAVVFRRGERTKISVAVRKSGVRLTSSHRTLVDWHGNPDRLSLRWSWVVPNTECLFLGSIDSCFKITKMELKPVTGRGQSFFRPKRVARPDRSAVERLLWHGGGAWVSADGQSSTAVRRIRDLPNSFRLTGVDWPGNRQFAHVDIPSLERFTDLQRLDLANTLLSDHELRLAAELPRLTELDMNLTSISDASLAFVGERWPGLRRLAVAGTVTSDKGMLHLEKLTQLEELDLRGTRISDAGVKSLQGFARLTHLALDHTQITDTAVAHLGEISTLAHVSLTGTAVSDTGLRHLGRLGNLRMIRLLGTQVSDEGIATLKQMLPQCTVVDDPRRSVDLLERIDPARDSVVGDWRLEGASLITPEEKWGRLQIPFSPPDEYCLELTAQRQSGRDSLAVGLVVGRRQVSVTFDGWPNQGPATVLETVDGPYPLGNETALKTAVFTTAEPLTMLITVRKSHITVACNGRLLIDWKGDIDRLGLPVMWEVPARDQLFIGSFKSRFRISKMRLVPLSE
jgi:serine/threonine protein kinase